MNTIPDLIPNVNIAGGNTDKTIQVNSVNTTDIKVDRPCNCSIESMVPNNIESIGSIKL